MTIRKVIKALMRRGMQNPTIENRNGCHIDCYAKPLVTWPARHSHVPWPRPADGVVAVREITRVACFRSRPQQSWRRRGGRGGRGRAGSDDMAARNDMKAGNDMETATPEPVSLIMLQFLAWVADRPRNYPETMEAWHSTCPRLSVWEDAIIDGLVRLENDAGRAVRLTPRGCAILEKSRA